MTLQTVARPGLRLSQGLRGLSLPPERVEIDVGEHGIGLRLLEDLGDDPTRWEITTREIEGHVVATCAERLGPGPVEIIVRRASLRLLVVGQPPG